MANQVRVYSSMTKANKARSDTASQSSDNTPNSNDTCRIYKNSALQTLNRWLPDDNGNMKGTYYNLDAFNKDVEVWNNVPIVFAKEHPDVEKFANKETRQQALEEVKGRIVGKTSNARIVKGGHPQLVVEMQICDKQANELWDEGKLSLSNAFQCLETDEGVIIGDFVANHVLVFEENFDQGDIPRDLASKVAKQKVNPMQATETNQGREFSRRNVDELRGWKAKLSELANAVDAWLGRAEPPEEDTVTDSSPLVPDKVRTTDEAVPHTKKAAPENTASNIVGTAASDSSNGSVMVNIATTTTANTATVSTTKTNADYPWDECMDDQMKRYGDETTAKKICGSIKARSGGGGGGSSDEEGKKNKPSETPEANAKKASDSNCNDDKENAKQPIDEVADDSEEPDEAESEADDYVKEPAKKNTISPVQADAQAPTKAEIANTASGDAEMDEKLKEEVNTLKAQKEAIEKELNAFKEKEFESQFTAFLANVKPGKKEKPEDVENIRKLYKENPRELLNKASEILVTGEGETKATGKPFVGVANKADKPSVSLGGLDKQGKWMGIGLQ